MPVFIVVEAPFAIALIGLPLPFATEVLLPLILLLPAILLPLAVAVETAAPVATAFVEDALLVPAGVLEVVCGELVTLCRVLVLIIDPLDKSL